MTSIPTGPAALGFGLAIALAGGAALASGCQRQRYRADVARRAPDPWTVAPGPDDSDSAYIRDRQAREMEKGRALETERRSPIDADAPREWKDAERAAPPPGDLRPGAPAPAEPDYGGDVFPPGDADPRQP
jgi:hypothetical protein